MLRKTLVLSLALITLSSTWADRLYVGVSTGPDMAHFVQHANIKQGTNFNVEDITHLSGAGFMGSIFAGYGITANQFYLAGEANANISSVGFESSNDEYIHKSFSSTQYRVPYSFGISLIPGFLITDLTLIYGRFGYALGNFKINTTDTSLANINRHLSGFRYGLGLNQSITPHLSILVEYNRTVYARTAFNVLDNTTLKTTRISPEVGQVQFGVAYNFI